MDVLVYQNNTLDPNLRKQRRKEALSYTLPKNTKDQLKANLNRFKDWCSITQLNPTPTDPETLMDYLTFLADSGRKLSTLRSSIWAIRTLHEQGRLEDPYTIDVKNHLRGLTNELKEMRSLQVRVQKKKIFGYDEIKAITFENSLLGLRDKALLLVGFIGGFRRSELTSIQTDDFEFNLEGISVFLHQTKNQKQAQVDIVKGKFPNFCAVTSLKEYQVEAKINDSFVFRIIRRGDHVTDDRITGTGVNSIVKKYAKQLGLNPKDYGGHSLRAGCATYLLDKGITPHIVQKHLRHKNFDTTQEYNRGMIAKNLVGIY